MRRAYGPMLLALALLLAQARMAHADESERALLRARGHHRKVLGATLIAVGGLLDAATTALTFTGLARGGWSLTPRDATDKTLLWTGVATNFVVDIPLSFGIVIYCQGGQDMRRAAE